MTRSVSMTEAQWKKLDKLRGAQSRGAYIAEQLKLPALVDDWAKKLKTKLKKG